MTKLCLGAQPSPEPLFVHHAQPGGCGGGLSPPLKKKIYYGVVVVVWGQVEMARHPALEFSTQLCSGRFKLSPIPKRGAGWKTPSTQPWSSAPSPVWGFTRRPRPIYRP